MARISDYSSKHKQEVVSEDRLVESSDLSRIYDKQVYSFIVPYISVKTHRFRFSSEWQVAVSTHYL